jgi:phage shock protein A
MFRAIGRLFRSFWLLLVGTTDSAADGVGRNPTVVKARYEDIIREKNKRLQEYRGAVANLMSQQQKKMDKLRALTEEVEKLEQLKAGALAKAKQRVGELEGKSREEIHADSEYQRCLAAYKDFTSTLDEKQHRIAELEQDVEDYRTRIEEHKIMLQDLMKEIDKLKDEKHEAVADVISANEEKQIADTISGISEDRTGEELQRLRDMRSHMKAEGRMAKEMAGTDQKAREVEFLEYAKAEQGNDEFDALIGLAEEKDTGGDEGKEEKTEESKLPE